MTQDDGSSSVTSSSSPLQNFSMVPLSPNLGIGWLKDLKSDERGLYLIHLLLTCGNHVASNSLENAEIALGQICELASPEGDTMQRIASYFAEALAQRIIRSWPGLHRALNATKLTLPSEEILVRKLFFEMFPFLKMAFLLTNQVIIEAMESEKMVHIIDLNAAEPAQWLLLMQAFKARPEGPPHLRITGIHQQKEMLDQMAHKLTEEAEKLDIPFQFNPIVSKLDNLDFDKLRVKTGEALAISSVLQLHSFLADSTSMDYFLNTLWGLSPKIMVITEQDSNHNGPTLMQRLLEALYTYAALFDCLESSVSRASMERLKVEKMLFGEEIKNIIGCEGGERKERHEKLEKWVQRLDFAGFGNVGLSFYGMLQARRLMQAYNSEGIRMKEENGCVVIAWQDRALFSVSAWRCRK